MEGITTYAYYALAGIVAAVVLLRSRSATNKHWNAIPIVGCSGVLSSWIAAVRFEINASEVVQEGYNRYKGRPFRVSTLDGWWVVVSGPSLTEDIRKSSDRYLTVTAAQRLQIEYTLGPEIVHDIHLIPIVRSQLTRSLTTSFLEIYDEVVTAFNDLIPLDESEWKTVSALESMMVIVCRATNRRFVGLPLCRDADYIDLNVKFTVDVVITGAIINLFPAFLRPLVTKLCTRLPAGIKRGIKHLKPIIDGRRRNPEDQPSDLISWLMDTLPKNEQSDRDLTLRVLAMNFAAIHVTSMTFTSALYHLAAQPEYAETLREEIERVTRTEGRTKDAVGKMPLLDSFIRESQRLNPLGCFSMSRKVREDFTLSDGTVIPAGTYMSVALAPTHQDEDIYSNARDFNGFRFAEEGSTNQGMVVTSSDFLSFGHGRHACPGRFFAATEVKTMLAHVVTTYDVKLKDGDKRPTNQWFGADCVPDSKAKVMFRRR